MLLQFPRLGKLVAIEGSDGAGKTTQIELLRVYLGDQDTPSALFDFPDYSGFYGQMARSYLSAEYGELDEISPYLAFLPYAMDRRHNRDRILAELSLRKIVLANRYVPSNLAHQGAKLPREERQDFFAWGAELEYEVNQMPTENAVIYLHVPVDISMGLVSGRGRRPTGEQTDIHEVDADYQRSVEESFLMLAKDSRWEVIECVEGGQLRVKSDIHQEVLDVLRDRDIIK